MNLDGSYPNNRLRLERWPYILMIFIVLITGGIFWSQSNLPGTGIFNQKAKKRLKAQLEKLPEVEKRAEPQETQDLARSVILLADTLGDNEAKAQALYWLSKAHLVENKFSEDVAIAESFALISRSLFLEEEDPIWLSKINSHLASINSYLIKQDSSRKQDLFSALEAGQSWTKKIVQSPRDSIYSLATLLKIQATVINILDYEDKKFDPDSLNKCISLTKKSLNFYKEVGDEEGMAITMRSLGDYYCKGKYLDSALHFFDESEKINQKIQSNIALQGTIYHESLCFKDRFRENADTLLFRKGLESIERAIQLPNKRKARLYLEAGILNHQAAYYAYLKKPQFENDFDELLRDAALSYQKGLNASTEENHLLVLEEIIQNFVDICGEFEGEFSCNSILKRANKSYAEVASNSRKAQVDAEQAFSDFRLSSLQRAETQQKSIIALAAGFLILLVVLIFVFNFDRIRSRFYKNQIHSNLKALQAQMSPHFISNSLNSIESLINLNENRKAANYLVEFSRLARMVLGFSRKNEISILEEMKMLKLYLSLERLRYSNRLHYRIVVDEKIDPDEIFIPPMMVQPFVENAIKHGIKNRPDGGNVSVKFIQEHPHLVMCIIEDNGVGREKAKELEAQSMFPRVSYSTQIIEERIDNLKILKGGDLRVIDLKNAKGEAMGTRVEILIRLLDKELT